MAEIGVEVIVEAWTCDGVEPALVGIGAWVLEITTCIGVSISDAFSVGITTEVTVCCVEIFFMKMLLAGAPVGDNAQFGSFPEINSSYIASYV